MTTVEIVNKLKELKGLLDNMCNTVYHHATRHALGGEDEIHIDASQVISGTFDLSRIPDLPRGKITDFFSSPFWDNIPDKPTAYPPEPHTHVRSEITDFFSAPFWDNIPDKPSQYPPSSHTHVRSDITDFFASPFWAQIPDKPFSTLSSEFTVVTGELQIASVDWSKVVNKPSQYPPEPHSHLRSDITDLFTSPFWDLIPDKPSKFPPEAHTHSRSDVTDFFAEPFWENIPDKPSAYPPETHTHSRSDITNFFASPFWTNIPDKPFSTLGSEFATVDGELQIASVDWSKVVNKPSEYPPGAHTHTRSEITDFWSEPFWDNIPDKPSEYPPEPHTHGMSDLTDFVNVSKVIMDTSTNRPSAGVAGRLFFETDTHIIYYDNGSSWVKLGVADWEDIEGKPSTYPPEPHTHTRDDVTDFWSEPFWSNIPDKPSVYPPEAHTHLRADIMDLFSSPFWAQIPDKPFEYLGSEFTVDTYGTLLISSVDFSKVTNRLSSLLTFDSSLIPASDSAYDLGGTTAKWKDAYLSGTLHASEVIGTVDWSYIANKPAQYPPEPHTHVRSDITDFFSTPFWTNIPDKPFEYLGSEFTVDTSGSLVVSSIDFSKITNRVSSLITFDSSVIPSVSGSLDIGGTALQWRNAYFAGTVSASEFVGTIDWGYIVNKPTTYPPSPHTHVRSEITDFFSEPFWDNIPDKPTEFPPESHVHVRADVTDLFTSPFWTQIPDKPFEYLGNEFTVDASGSLVVSTISFTKVTDRLSSLITFNSSVIPDAHGTYDIGVSGTTWRHGYFSGTVYASEFVGTIDWSYVANKPSEYPPASHTHLRSEVTDFWATPFWDNIPDKPSTYPPSPHTHVRSEVTDLFSSPFWTNIPDKPFEQLGDEFTVSAGTLLVSSISFTKVTDRFSSLITYDSSILPIGSGSFDIGGTTAYWRHGYFSGTVYASEFVGTVDWGCVVNKPSEYPPEAHTHSRSDVTDFFSSPFWTNVPDKPFATLGAEFTVSDGELQISSVDWSKVANKPSEYPPESHTHDYTDIILPTGTWSGLDADKLDGYDASAFAMASHTHSRSDITDFFSEPFWENIPDKPSTFPPESHTHSRSDITDLWGSPFWDNIPDKPFEGLGSEFTVSSGQLQIAGIDAGKVISGVLDLARIPNIDWQRIQGNFPRYADEVINKVSMRGWLEFDGVDDYCEVPDSPSLNVASGQELSIVVIARAMNVGSHYLTFVRKGYGYHNAYALGIGSNGRLEFDYYNTDVDEDLFVYGETIEAGEMFMGAVTVSDEIKLYKNAALVASVAKTVDLKDYPQPVRIGAWGTTHPLNGQIAYVLIYNRALSDEEIQQIYNDPLNPPTDGLVLWLDGSSIDYANRIWKDKSGNGNDATIYGAVPGGFPPKFHTHSSVDVVYNSSLIPSVDNIYDLGNESLRWRNGYFAGTVKSGGLNVNGSPIVLSLAHNGGGKLYLLNNPNDNAIYLEGFSSDESTSASFIAITGRLVTNLPEIILKANDVRVYGNIKPSANNAYDLGDSSHYWRNIYVNNVVVNGWVVINSNRVLSNCISDLRYGANYFTLYNFQPNNLYLAHKRGYTITWNDTTGLSNIDSIWEPDTSEGVMTIDLSQSADPLVLTVEGTLAISSNVAQNRLVVVWHGGKGYNDIKFEIKRNDGEWVEVPLEYEFGAGSGLYQVSERINKYAPYPTYTPWKGFRITFSNKVATSGYKYLYGIIYYVPKSPFWYFVMKKGDTVYGTLSTEVVCPRVDNIYDLGSESLRWREAHIVDIIPGKIWLKAKGTRAHYIYWNSDDDKDYIVSNDFVVYSVNLEDMALYVSRSITSVRHLRPFADNSYDLGTSSLRWRNGYFAGVLDAGSLKIGGAEVITKNRVLQNVTTYQGLKFDGEDDYAEVPAWAGDGQDLTIIALIRPLEITGSGTSAPVFSSYYSGWGFQVFSNRIVAKMMVDGTEYGVDLVSKPILGNTLFLAETVDYDSDTNTTTLKGYFNGEYKGETNATGTPDHLSNRAWKMAIYGSAKMRAIYYMILAYNRVLSEDEIQQIYNDPDHPPTDGLVLWLAPDSIDYANGVWRDKSGNGNDAVIYGAVPAGFPAEYHKHSSADIVYNSSMIPNVDNAFDLGNDSYRWRNGHFAGTVYANEFVGNSHLIIYPL